MVHSTAQKILWQLLSVPGSWVSGNDLAQRFNISRESVWKAINSLRKNGNNITLLIVFTLKTKLAQPKALQKLF